MCIECIKVQINENYPDVECPDEECGALMPEWEIAQIIGKESLEELQ